MAAANQYLAEQFLPAYNRRFAVSATEPGTAFVRWIGTGLTDMLCVQEERVVANDNTVRYQGKSLQIPPDRHRFHYVKVTVRVHAYPDGALAVFHGPRCLARYQPNGQVIEPGGAQPRRCGPPHGSGGRSIVAPKPIGRNKVSTRG